MVFLRQQAHERITVICMYLIVATSGGCHAHWDGAYMRHADDGFTTRYDWMSRIRDDVQLSELALPGTHNSAGYIKLQTPLEMVNGFYESVVNDWRKKNSFASIDDIKGIISIDIQATQVLNIRQQLQYGIRAFDVSLIYSKDKFGLIHKEQDTFLNLMLDQFFHQLTIFFDDNPSETVLVLLALKEEVGENEKTPRTRLDEYLQDSAVVQYYLKTNNTRVTLGEARGKFVILSKDVNFKEYSLGSDVFDVEGTKYLRTNWDLYHRSWEPIKSHLSTARSGNKNTFYISYLSGYGGSFPYFVASGHSSPWTSAPRLATGLTTPGWWSSYPDFPRVTCFIGICTIAFEGTNILTRDAIQAYNSVLGSQTRSVGIVMADFPGDSLISRVIENNAPLRKDSLADNLL